MTVSVSDSTESMMTAGPKKPATASLMFGTAMSSPHRKIAPITKAPATEPSTALGASCRGLWVSSASVEAVSNPCRSHTGS